MSVFGPGREQLAFPFIVATSGITTLAVGVSGRVYAWGKNDNQSLGVNNPTPFIKTPTLVVSPELEGQNVIQVLTDSDQHFLLTETGQLFAWGDNANQSLGVNNPAPFITIPTRVPFPPELAGQKIIQIFTRSVQHFLLTEIGQLFAWGDNANQSLGVSNPAPFITTPTPVPFPAGQRVTRMFSEFGHHFAVTNTMLFAWGNNNSGCLGVENMAPFITTPTPVEFSDRLPKQEVVQIVTNLHMSFFLTKEGLVFACGRNENQSLGVERPEPMLTIPALVIFPGKLPPQKVIHIATDRNATFAVTERGELFAWGGPCNDSGRNNLGIKNAPLFITTPTLIPLPIDLTGDKIVQLLTHSAQHFILTETGRLFVWGSKSMIRSTTEVRMKVGIPFFKEYTSVEDILICTPLGVRKFAESKIMKVISKYNSTFLITQDGSLYAWGENYNHKLGIGENSADNPIAV